MGICLFFFVSLTSSPPADQERRRERDSEKERRRKNEREKKKERESEREREKTRKKERERERGEGGVGQRERESIRSLSCVALCVHRSLLCVASSPCARLEYLTMCTSRVPNSVFWSQCVLES